LCPVPDISYFAFIIERPPASTARVMNRHDPDFHPEHRPAQHRRSGFVHIVDDDAAFLKAMERHLKHGGYDVATYGSAQQLLDRLPSGNGPSCLILDVRMPGLDGPALQKRLGELGARLPIIFLTGHADTATIVRTIKAGAHDFLSKPVQSDILLRAIERAFLEQQASRGLHDKLDAVRTHVATLTPRERQVFQLIIGGSTNRQIGRALGATERTIKAHRHRVMEKMQVRTLAELVSLAEQVGIASATGQTN
jgi:FixJ family two-component response regulator